MRSLNTQVLARLSQKSSIQIIIATQYNQTGSNDSRPPPFSLDSCNVLFGLLLASIAFRVLNHAGSASYDRSEVFFTADETTRIPDGESWQRRRLTALRAFRRLSKSLSNCIIAFCVIRAAFVGGVASSHESCDALSSRTPYFPTIAICTMTRRGENKFT